MRQKRVDLEEENEDKLEALREKLDKELQEEQEQLEKKHAYKMEQLRQLMDNQGKVRISFRVRQQLMDNQEKVGPMLAKLSCM